MTSASKVEANRRNAARSTGPRTPEGKSRSRLNALTHGLTAQTPILPGEDPREFQRRLETWTADLAPCNTFEEDLVRQVVSLSWRLDRADRVQQELIKLRIEAVPDEEAERRRQQVEDLGARLLPPPRVPEFKLYFGVSADIGRYQTPKSPDDPDDPARLLGRLESTAAGCRWLIDRWAELRPIVDAGTAWPAVEMVDALRLLGKHPLDSADDHEVLEVVVACFALDRSRPDPFAALWETAARVEARAYRERLIGRRLREAMPPSKEQAREVLLGVVDVATERLEERERQHRERDEIRAAARADCLAYDDSREGEWVRRQQGTCERSLLRIVGRLRAARRRGESLSPAPPARPERKPNRPTQTSERKDAKPRKPEKEDHDARPGWKAEDFGFRLPDPPQMPDPPDLGYDRPRAPKRRRRRRRKVTAELAQQIAIRGIKWLISLGLACLIVTTMRPTEGSPPSDRPDTPEASAVASDRDGSRALPSPGLAGRNPLTVPPNPGSYPRNHRNEPTLPPVYPVFSVVQPRFGRSSDRSRGPPGPRGDPTSADRTSSESSRNGPPRPRAPRMGRRVQPPMRAP